MKKYLLYLIGFALVGGMGVVAQQANRPQPNAPKKKTVSITGYRHWVRVNAQPHPVASHLAALYRDMTPQEQAQYIADPHRDKFVTVYVNETAKRAMLTQKRPHFPQGSILVKEKLSEANSKTPELLTVMHKREAGYAPLNGDWEYLVWNGTGTERRAQGRLKECQSCHAQWKATDYVSRAYLTTAAQRQLQ